MKTDAHPYKINTLDELAGAIEAAGEPERRILKFGVASGFGRVITDSEQVVRLLCGLWNHRHAIAALIKENKNG